MELIEKYQNLLSFFDPKFYNHQELANNIEIIINKIKEKNGQHQEGCAWVILTLYKRDKCDIYNIDTLIDEFNEYVKGYDDYINSLSISTPDAPMTYFNAFLDKKTKGV